MRIKLFTHTDLDGVGCPVIGKIAFGEALNTTYCNYEEVDDKVLDTITNDLDEFDAIFITDISVKEHTAKVIDSVAASKVVLLDHHPTALFLNEYSWASVSPREADGKTLSSGTSLFFHYLVGQNLLTPSEELTQFVETVRLYDTWDWAKGNDTTPKQLNDLFSLIGRYKFLDRFSKNPDVSFNLTERTLLEVEEARIERYLKVKRKELREISVDGWKIGVVSGESYHSEVGNTLATENPHLDVIAIINFSRKQVSLRGLRATPDCGVFSKDFGGGGHPNAGGFPFNENISERVISAVFDK